MIVLVAQLLFVQNVLVAIAALRGYEITAWLFASYALVLPLALVITTTHELGHAVAARALGLRVPRISLGIGRRIARIAVGETTVHLHAVPIGGMTFFDGDVAGRRAREWLATLAGPVVTAGVLVLAIAMAPPARWYDVAIPGAIVERFAPWELLGALAAWNLVLNLVPAKLGHVANDGLALLRIPRGVVNPPHLMTSLLAADDYLDRGDLERARAAVERAERAQPQSYFACNARLCLEIEQRAYDAARATAERLLKTDAPNAGIRAVVKNNLAWIMFVQRRDEDRAQADALSADVERQFAQEGWALSTRGAVLWWLGRGDEAVPLLKTAFARSATRKNRALAAALLGFATADTAWTERARALDPQCPLLATA